MILVPQWASACCDRLVPRLLRLRGPLASALASACSRAPAAGSEGTVSWDPRCRILQRLRQLRVHGTATQDWCAAGGHASQSVSSPRLLSVSWQRRWSAAWRTGRPQSLARRCAEKPRPCWGLGFFAASMVVTSIRLLFGVSPVIWRSHTASVRVSWEGVWRRWRRQLCSHRDRLRLPRGATACFHVEIPRRASRATACFRQDTATAHCDVAGRID